MGTLVALLLPAVVAVASTFSAALVVVSVAGGSPRPAASAPLAAGALMGVLTAWWGPGGASLRRGARSLVRGTVRGRSASEVVVTGLLLAAAGLGIWAWLAGRRSLLVAVDTVAAAVPLAATTSERSGTFRAPAPALRWGPWTFRTLSARTTAPRTPLPTTARRPGGTARAHLRPGPAEGVAR